MFKYTLLQLGAFVRRDKFIMTYDTRNKKPNKRIQNSLTGYSNFK